MSEPAPEPVAPEPEAAAETAVPAPNEIEKTPEVPEAKVNYSSFSIGLLIYVHYRMRRSLQLHLLSR